MGVKTRGHSSWEKVAKALEKAAAELAARRAEPAPARAGAAWGRYAHPDPVEHVRSALDRQRARRAAGGGGAAVVAPRAPNPAE